MRAARASMQEARARAGYACTPAMRAKISAANRGKKRSPEFRAAVRAAMVARWAQPEQRERARQRRGRRHSEEAKARMSAAAIARYQDPKEREKTGASRRGTKMPPMWAEWRAKISRALKTSPHAKAHRARLGRICPTSIETQLCNALDAAGVEYVFQYPVPKTPYIADFYLPLRNALLEADGEYWHRRADTVAKDAVRDTVLSGLGYRVVRLGEKRIRALTGGAELLELLR